MTNGEKVNLFDIQRFCIHDGPGIRTTVFLKGCPMFCPWCANPESQDSRPDLLYMENKCVRCGRCAAVCPQKAVNIRTGNPVFDRDKCIRCGACVRACLRDAISLAGRTMTVEEILTVVGRDKDYYRNTGGGLTVSGGEPLCQPNAVVRLFAAAKRIGIHTALETAASVPETVFRRVLPVTDLFLFDLKYADAKKLKQVTGADMDQVLCNLKAAVRAGSTIVRIPVVPGYNSTEAELSGMFRIAAESGAKQVDLLAYHLLGKNKYAQLGRPYPYRETEALPKHVLEPYRDLGKEFGLSVTIGGK